MTLTGSLNGDDIITIRAMDSLLVLNLTDANIVSGGIAYSTQANTISNFSDLNLISAKLPKSITTIGNSAFRNCSRLNSVNIPLDVTIIGVDAFFNCSCLTSVIIPNSLTIIGAGAFYDCSGLKSINIPNSVTDIGAFAFLGCKSLSTVTISSSITIIQTETFSGCLDLTSIYVNGDVPAILGLANFNWVTHEKCILYVPCGSSSKYTSAEEWKDFKSIVEFGCTGIDPFLICELKILPNPTSGIIKIEGLPNNQKSRISVYTLDGKLIKIKTTNAILGLIDISNQISGSYLLKVNNQTFKIVKE